MGRVRSLNERNAAELLAENVVKIARIDFFTEYGENTTALHIISGGFDEIVIFARGNNLRPHILRSVRTTEIDGRRQYVNQ